MIKKIFESRNNEISLAYFHYNKRTKVFSQEISSLPKNIFWPDLDEIVLFSPKTGNKVVFKFIDTDLDYEDEIQGWRYSSNDVLFTGELLIIND